MNKDHPCFPQTLEKEHHLPKANIIQKDRICPSDKRGLFVGAPKMIRTSDTRFRKPLLYPLSYKGNLFLR